MSMMGVILAGGKSTRMKQDKAMLNFGGIGLLQRQFAMLESLLGRGNVIVSGDRPDYPHVKDMDSSLGPLEGLRSVSHSLLNKGQICPLLVVPVDMPFMTPHGLNRLIHAASDEPMTKFRGRTLPLVVNKPLVVFEAIEKMKAGADTARESSFKNLFKKIEVQEIEAEPEHFFANINTPEDWDATLS
ncbi:MAG TPA: molybdenum cofactor guanylyltransferase [Bdellovibrionales bacterium]|nr:molybdenum cofactor guanylyltransferase [Bdellovibrionales bacterium]